MLRSCTSQIFVKSFVGGLIHDFRVSCSGPQQQLLTKHSATANLQPEIVAVCIDKEVWLAHAVGLVNEPPLHNFVVSSHGVRPETTGGARLVMDLSRPFGN